MSTLRKKRPLCIGYLASGLFNSYNHLVWQGISDYCRKRNAVFIYFVGGELGSPDFTQRSRHFIFDLAAFPVIDGLLINSTTTFHHVGTDKVLDFYKAHAGLPILSIGAKVGDWPAVMTDGASGIREAVLHLVREHGYRSIAFIAGPENHAESNQRLNAFKSALSECGIPFDDALLAYGDFLVPGGIAGFDKLLAHGLSFNAVLCASDEMALGVLRRARELDISVPHDLAVCGFDDIPRARTSSEPLSTVRQPIEQESATACRLLFELINGSPFVEDVVLPTSLVVRRSCGCLSPEIKRAGEPVALQPFVAQAEHTNGFSGITALCALLREKIDPPDPDTAVIFDAACLVLTDSLKEHLRTDGADASVCDLRNAMSDLIHKGSDEFHIWEDAITLLRRRAASLSGPFLAPAVEAFWQRSRVMIQEASHQFYFSMDSREHLTSARSREINWKIIRSFDLPLLLETIRRELPGAGIEACYLCLLEKTGEEEKARLIMAYNRRGAIALPEGGHLFHPADLLPAEYDAFSESGDFFVEALFVEDKERLGYVVLRTKPGAVHFEDFRRQISSALKGALLTDEVRALASAQQERAVELALAYETLKANQQKMISIEKMASIGRLTAGIAHEMNTPIATIRAAALEMKGLINEYSASIDSPSVTADDHRAIAGEMHEDCLLIHKAAERTAAFVQSVKSQTRNLSGNQGVDFDAIKTVEEVNLILGHLFKKENCSIEFLHPGKPVILSGAEGRFSQVVTNLLTNAVDASKPKGGGPLRVELLDEGSEILLIVEDKGTGITDADMPCIFDPMFTTKSMAEGTGLGLSITRDIVSGEFGGRIEVKTHEGDGTVFAVHMQKTLKEEPDGQNNRKK